MSEIPAGGRPLVISESIVGAQVVSPAKKLTHNIGGSWFGDRGAARCPVCETSDALTITDGHSKPQVCCSSGCDRRVIIAILRTRRAL
jgi:hypothetical protein